MSGRIDREADRASAIVGLHLIAAGWRWVLVRIVVVLWAFAVGWLAARTATMLVFGSADLRTGHLAAVAGSSTLAWIAGMILTRRRGRRDAAARFLAVVARTGTVQIGIEETRSSPDGRRWFDLLARMDDARSLMMGVGIGPSMLAREADRMRSDVHAALAQEHLTKGALEWAWAQIESMRPIALLIDRLRSAPGGAATPAFAVPACADCGERPAVCVGAYDSGSAGPSPACGECCGHGRKDGSCRPLAGSDWVRIGTIA